MKTLSVFVIVAVCAVAFSGCGMSKEERMLEMKLEHELKMKELERKQNQSSLENATDSVIDGAVKKIFK